MTGYSLCGIAELNVEGSRGFFPLMAWKKGVGTLLKRAWNGIVVDLCWTDPIQTFFLAVIERRRSISTAEEWTTELPWQEAHSAQPSLPLKPWGFC